MEEKKPVLLVVSYGTSHDNARQSEIGGIERALQAAYPEYEVRRAFTSNQIIRTLLQRSGEHIDNVVLAMERILTEGVRDVVVQSIHMIKGYEYDEVVRNLGLYREKLNSMKIGRPLMGREEDFASLAEFITGEFARYRSAGTAIVLVAYGTGHPANAAYPRLQQILTESGCADCFVGTLEGNPTMRDVLERVKASGAKRVVLVPMVIVAGENVVERTSGDAPDSWKSVFEAEGFRVKCVMTGLGQYDGIRRIFVRHVGDAIKEW